jgi:outer membrane lipoprotein-sorting protein
MKLSRREFALFTTAFAALPHAALAQNSAMKAPPSPPRRASFTAVQKEDLARISAYLNGIGTLVADFSQINPQGGVSQGAFYLSRPGRLRFEYRAPSPTLIVANRGNIYVRNSRLNTVDTYSVSDTPLELLLRENIDMERNPAILGVDRIAGADGQLEGLALRARSSTNRMQDNITIAFAVRPTFEIRQWTVRDAQGGRTQVGLSRVRMDVELPDSVFAVPVRAPSTRKN